MARVSPIAVALLVGRGSSEPFVQCCSLARSVAARDGSLGCPTTRLPQGCDDSRKQFPHQSTPVAGSDLMPPLALFVVEYAFLVTTR